MRSEKFQKKKRRAKEAEKKEENYSQEGNSLPHKIEVLRRRDENRKTIYTRCDWGKNETKRKRP